MANGDELFDPTVPLDAPLPELVASLKWYHTLDLPGGVTTPGYYDLRSVAPSVPIPDDLSGKRCLDAASADGFWAFRMAQRGAAEVVSVDLDDHARQDWQGVPAPGSNRGLGTGRARRAFDIVNHTTGLGVKRHNMSVYDISREELGTFDFVFQGNVLLHLSDPQKALLALRNVCTGEFLSFEAISLPLSIMRPFAPSAQLWHDDDPRWWTPNVQAHRRLAEASGFEIIDSKWPLFSKFGDLIPKRPNKVPVQMKEWVYWLFVRRFGVASQWLRCRPV
jgi:tRNA (mo5U34)-methyltransferase